MKRLHVHVAVADLQEAIAFYNTLFAAEPTVQESDYAKWMLDDPRVNFAISMRGRPPGLDHLGLQVESDDELQQVASALAASGRHVIDEPNAQCCYATGNKAWVADPAGVLWESFRTTGGHPTYGEDNAQTQALADGGVAPSEAPASARAGSCCGPASPAGAASPSDQHA